MWLLGWIAISKKGKGLSKGGTFVDGTKLINLQINLTPNNLSSILPALK